MFTITKQFQFEASHQLKGLPAGHKCGRLHGHSYRVEVELQSEVIDQIGFVRDYGDLSTFAKFLDEHFDHTHLNDIETIDVAGYVFRSPANPTAEAIAKFFYEVARRMFPEVTAMRISETGKTWACYHPTKENHEG